MRTILSESERTNGFLMLALTSCVSRDMLTSSEIAVFKKYPSVYDVQKTYVLMKDFNPTQKVRFLEEEGLLDRAILTTLRFLGLNVEDISVIKRNVVRVGLFYGALQYSLGYFESQKMLIPFLRDGVEGVLGTFRSRVFSACFLNTLDIGDMYGFSVPVCMATVGAGFYALYDIEEMPSRFSETFLKRLRDTCNNAVFNEEVVNTTFITDEMERIISEVDLCRGK
jgi:hypothetical protein